MKILHCCLGNYYVDNNSFQENILTKMHKLQGHNVSILASTETFIQNTQLGYVKPSIYINEDGISVKRIPYIKYIPHYLASKIRLYKGILDVLQTVEPDIIFIHGPQFLGIKEIVSYKKKNPSVTIYVDSHTDYINAKWNKNTIKAIISKHILHKIIYKYCTQLIEPFTKIFYGTLPSRVDFLSDVYKIPIERIRLLEMGYDDELLDNDNKDVIRKNIRESHNISEKDFVLITGGKINKGKNIINLLTAIHELQIDEIKLLIFGTPDKDLKAKFEELINISNVIYLNWIPTKKIYEYYFASDLGIFPGKHSVLWEQAVGAGLPCVFKKWDKVDHIDLGGNCILLDHADTVDIKKIINDLYWRRDVLNKMKSKANSKEASRFSYFEIAKRAIEQ